jgi:hypothetical protein
MQQGNGDCKKALEIKGSPCLSPLLCLIRFPTLPFAMIQDEEVLHISESKSLQRRLNPNLSISSNIYSHETESKAHAISNLKKKKGYRLSMQDFYRVFDIKVFFMNVVFIKAFWLWGSCTEGKGPICLPSSCKPVLPLSASDSLV